MKEIIETKRLRLRQFTFDDTKFIIELLNSPAWLKYIGDRNIKTEEDAKAYLANGAIKSYREHGFGLSMVELKDGNTPIGMCGLIKRDSLGHPDLGFAFLPEFIGQGFGFEIASALMAQASDKLYLKTILGITIPENKNSIKLLEKLGMKFVKKFHSPGDEEELLLYSN